MWWVRRMRWMRWVLWFPRVTPWLLLSIFVHILSYQAKRGTACRAPSRYIHRFTTNSRSGLDHFRASGHLYPNDCFHHKDID